MSENVKRRPTRAEFARALQTAREVLAVPAEVMSALGEEAAEAALCAAVVVTLADDLDAALKLLREVKRVTNDYCDGVEDDEVPSDECTNETPCLVHRIVTFLAAHPEPAKKETPDE